MPMKLVRKKAPRGGFVRWLEPEEEKAVHNFYGVTRDWLPEETKRIQNLLLKMREEELWLQCDCVIGDSPALNSANLMHETRKLFLAGFSQPHARHCPMFREFKRDDGATSTGTRKAAASRRINYRDFLPRDESGATITAPGVAVDNIDRTRRKRIPRIARLLLTLIVDAGLNCLDSLSPLPQRKPIESIQLLKDVADRHDFIGGRPLSQIVRFQPGMSEKGREQLMLELESDDRSWPANRSRLFYQIFMSENVSRSEVKFSWAGGEIAYMPERGVSINGESQEGVRPPYWVILAFRRGMDGKVICSEGYAHALYSRQCPVPVDSNLERETLKSISTVASWFNNKNESPQLSLVKPLFDIEVNVADEKGFVLPDFIVSIRKTTNKIHTVIVETMGYNDDEYCERKSVQHVGMRTLGQLCTDPPKWPLESEKPFTKNFYGIIKNIT